MKALVNYKMSKVEKETLQREINRQILDHEVDCQNNIDAMVLYTLAQEFGFGKVRLRRFYDSLVKGHNNIKDYYQFNNREVCELYKSRLKKIGVDIVKWNEELS